MINPDDSKIFNIDSELLLITAKLDIILNNQAKILAKQENKDFTEVQALLLKQVQNRAEEIFAHLPSE